jgi:transmembrane sensor
MNAKVITLESGRAPALRAQEWVVRIDSGPLTVQERQDLQAWLAEDNGNVKLLDTHALLWSEATRANFPFIASGSANTVVSQGQYVPAGMGAPQGAPASKGLRWQTYGYLSALISLFLAFLLWNSTMGKSVDVPGVVPSMLTSIKTDIGQNLELPLVDGSRVHLNTASTIQVDYSKQRRRVVLDNGEGLFDVAKDANRPFEVVAGTTTVRAIGTRFSVIRFPDGRTDVTVFEGVVEILAAQTEGITRPLRLGVGQTVTVQSEKIALQQLSKPALENKLAWREERIVFDNVSLVEAITQVNRYSSLPLRLTNPDLMNLHVSGAFSTPDIQVFVRSLEQGFGLHVERTANSYLISKTSVR